jgi:hypothetical protein
VSQKKKKKKEGLEACMAQVVEQEALSSSHSKKRKAQDD